MTTYLFTWNPARWPWTYLQKSIAEVEDNGYCREPWSCGVTKKIAKDDRAFLIKLGSEPRGIIASGWVIRSVYKDKHWDEQKRLMGKTALYINADWDTILDPSGIIFELSRLTSNIYEKMHWEPQASGIRISNDVAEQLEKDWAYFLNRPVVIAEPAWPEEVDPTRTYIEGATRQVTVNLYERNAEARTICINYYGTSCSVCGFKFEGTYGKMGTGFIHVHHIKPLAEIRKGYKLNPIKDLRPVCPNCHAMIHQRKPAYSIEELRAIIERIIQ
jgi:5-methylcytosine-specific restriction enzyme A